MAVAGPGKHECAHASALERDLVLLSLTQGHVNIWGREYGQQITTNTLQIAVACGRGTMTGLCSLQLASAILLLLSAVCF